MKTLYSIRQYPIVDTFIYLIIYLFIYLFIYLLIYHTYNIYE
jgi:hypothetical protein